MAEYFQAMNQDWRGWSDERRWASLESDLRLSARHDGHIRLEVVLVDSTNWTVTTEIALAPGEELSAATEALVGSSPECTDLAASRAFTDRRTSKLVSCRQRQRLVVRVHLKGVEQPVPYKQQQAADFVALGVEHLGFDWHRAASVRAREVVAPGMSSMVPEPHMHPLLGRRPEPARVVIARSRLCARSWESAVGPRMPCQHDLRDLRDRPDDRRRSCGRIHAR